MRTIALLLLSTLSVSAFPFNPHFLLANLALHQPSIVPKNTLSAKINHDHERAVDLKFKTTSSRSSKSRIPRRPRKQVPDDEFDNAWEEEFGSDNEIDLKINDMTRDPLLTAHSMFLFTLLCFLVDLF